MKNKLWILLLLIGVGCQKADSIEKSAILGHYVNLEGFEDYSHLELRTDNTYDFDQAIMYSCDIWRHFHGGWSIVENRLVLYEGINLDSIIEVKNIKNLKSDTLRIVFEKSFLEEFIDLKINLGNDTTEIEIKNGKIILDKHNYCISKNVFQDHRDKESTLKYYPLILSLRSGNYYYEGHYILNLEEIHFGLGNFKKVNLPKKKLMEYKLYNGILKPTKTSKWINKHALQKRDTTKNIHE